MIGSPNQPPAETQEEPETLLKPNGVVYRAYKAGDELAAIALFKRTFQKPITESHWLWKYRQHQTPVDNVWFAFHDGKLIGQFSGMLAHLRYAESEFKILIGADAMIAPEFQGLGVGSQLIRIAQDNWKEVGITMVMALPNDRWGSVLEKAGWELCCHLRILYYPIKPTIRIASNHRLNLAVLSPLAKAWRRLHQLRASSQADVSFEPITSVTSELGQLWEQVRAGPNLGLVRDTAWLHWRYFDPRGENYRCHPRPRKTRTSRIHGKPSRQTRWSKVLLHCGYVLRAG